MKNLLRQEALDDAARSPVLAANNDEDHQPSSREKPCNSSALMATSYSDVYYTHRHKKFCLKFSKKRRLQQFQEDHAAALSNFDLEHVLKSKGTLNLEVLTVYSNIDWPPADSLFHV
jgi:hypothetical protein